MSNFKKTEFVTDPSELTEDMLLTLDDLSDEDWREIEDLSMKIHKSDFQKKRFIHCIFDSFFLWLDKKNKVLVRDESSQNKIVH